MPTAEILSQGDEVITGQTVDTNAAWLATRLTDLGFTVLRHTTVGDRLQDIQQQFAHAAGRADLVLCTGGLGPTDDDLTAAAVAGAFSAPLQLHDAALDDIRERYAAFGRPMPQANTKQAMLPAGATKLTNHWGTAPGFHIHHGGTHFFCFAGVPREMRRLFDAYVLPFVAEHLAVRPARLVTLRTTGVGESNLQDRIGTFSEPDVVLGYRTKLPENHIKLRFQADVPASRVLGVTQRVADLVGSPIFTIEGLDDGVQVGAIDTQGGDLAAVVGRALLARGQTVATAESCTGGRVASMFTGIPGSSGWFLEGAVTYSNPSKVRQLGVQQATLDAHGAVSEPVARQMAEGIRQRAGADWGLSTTGIAGPGGGTADKPVGLVHIAVAGPDGTQHRSVQLGGFSRDRVQTLSAAGVIDMLRRMLQPSFHLST